MEPNHPTPPLGFFLWLACFLSGADPDLMSRSPARDRSSVATIALLMLLIWVWQVLAFSLSAHMMLDETSRVRPELVAVAALLATVVMLIDSFTVIRSSWFLSGLAQLKRGGLAVPGHLGAKVKNGLQYLFRFPLAAVLAELAAIGVMLFCFQYELLKEMTLKAIAANAPLEQRVSEAYDGGSVRLVTEIEQLKQTRAAAEADAASYRRDTLQVPKDDPELKPAAEQLRRAEAARIEAERRLSRLPAADSAERRAVWQRVTARRADSQAAQARLDRLRTSARGAVAERREAVQGRLEETLGAEQRLQERIEAKEREHAARIAGRAANIRAAMERDPGYRPPDRGLLARAKALATLMEDRWAFTVVMLLHAGFFGIELGAVLCKALTSVPSSYAVMLAGEEYANDVATANAVFARFSGSEPRDLPDAEPVEPEPTQPLSGDAAAEAPEPAANDDIPPANGQDADITAARLEEGARQARAQAAARAKASKPKPPAKSSPPAGIDAQSDAEADVTPTALAGALLDGPVLRGRGRPPGAKNRPKIDDAKADNDAGKPADGTEAA